MKVVNHDKKFIYYIVPKSASASLLMWFYETLGISVSDKPHAYLNEHRKELTFIDKDDPNYYKFTFIRNPWRRLVSAYLQKIVMRSEDKRLELEIGKKAIIEIQQKKKEPIDFIKGVTFDDFVKYICDSNPEINWINKHWIPQSTILQGEKLDFLGIVENIDAEMQWLQQKINTDAQLPRINIMNYAQKSNECVSEFPASVLRKIYPFPYYKDFYNPNLIEMVEHIYKEDIELYAALQKRELHQRGFPLE